jgi:hypothetical protein
MLAWRLTNTSRAPVQVLAEMETPGRADFDAVTVRIRPLGRATAEADPITLMGKRTAVRKVLEVLTPGTALTRAFDLAMFAGYYGIRLEPGKYRVDATYDAGATGVLSEAERARSFTGRLFAPAVTITIGR